MKRRTLKNIFLGLAILVVGYAAYTFIRIQLSLKAKQNACIEHLTVTLSSDLTPEEIFQRSFSRLQSMVEYSLVARSRMLEVAGRLRENRDQPLSSADLLTLKQGTEDYLEIREELYYTANAYECGIEVDEETLAEYGISPELRLKGLMLSLSAALTLYDNYLIGTVMFEQDSRLRQVINDPDMGFGLVANTLREMTLSANSIEQRHRIRRVIKFYEEQKEILDFSDEDSDFAYLDLLIQSSPAYTYAKKIRIDEIAKNKFVAFERITADVASDLTEDGFDLVSGVFGNSVGLIESRKGKLFGDVEAKANLQAQLQPLDILLEKTPFRLTDKLIPGHFGHVAIWTGTKAELIDLGLWDEQYVKQYHDFLASGTDPNSKNEQHIIEALRSGVQLSSLDHFMNVDDLAVLRPIFTGEATEQQKKEALLMAFRQLGKKYDFNFDVNTTDKIVCSELAYISFPSIDWPTQKTLGRYSISPDHVAKLAWNNVPLELVMFYHDGKLVAQEEQVDRMIELMQE